jgi:hypothetical protein
MIATKSARVPEALRELWRELHPGTPLQMQLPFANAIALTGRLAQLNE